MRICPLSDLIGVPMLAILSDVVGVMSILAEMSLVFNIGVSVEYLLPEGLPLIISAFCLLFSYWNHLIR